MQSPAKSVAQAFVAEKVVLALVREPIGFHVAPRIAFIEQRKLWDIWKPSGKWSPQAPRLSDQDLGLFFTGLRWMRCACCSAHSARDRVEVRLSASANAQRTIWPRDRGTNRSHHVRGDQMRMAEPLQPNRLHCKGCRLVRPIGLLFAIVCVQCKLRRIEAKTWKASHGEGFFWATPGRGVARCVWELACSGHQDLLKACQRLIDAAVRSCTKEACRAVWFGWRAVASPARHRSRARCRHLLLQLLLVGLLREVRSSHPTV